MAVNSARIAAAIVYNNEIVSIGINSRKSHPFQVKYAKNDESIYLHAENAAIYTALRNLEIDELTKSTLYICRVKYTSQRKDEIIFGMAKPCVGCCKAIARFNITKVAYTLDGTGYDWLATK